MGKKICISVFRHQRLLWLVIFFTENLHFDRPAKVVMTCERASLHDHRIVSAMLPGNVLFFWNEVTFCFNCNVLIGSWVTFFGIDRRMQWSSTGSIVKFWFQLSKKKVLVSIYNLCQGFTIEPIQPVTRVSFLFRATQSPAIIEFHTTGRWEYVARDLLSITI